MNSVGVAVILFLGTASLVYIMASSSLTLWIAVPVAFVWGMLIKHAWDDRP